MRKMRIAVIGAGAMGTVIGALLTEGGCNVELIDTYKEHVEAMNKDGIHIIGKIDRHIKVKAIFPNEASGYYDLILSLTKHSRILSSLEAIKSHTYEDTIVLTLQNGLPEAKAAGIYPHKNVFGGSMEFSATFKAPGVTELTSGIETVAICFGSYDGPITDKVRKVKSVLDCVGKISITDNIKGIKWSKLTINAVFSGLPTALNCTVGDVLKDEKAMDVAVHLGRECANVIHGLGVDPVRIFAEFGTGMKPVPERIGFYTEAEKEAVIKYWKAVEAPFVDLVPSMLQDIRRGKKCEVQDINGEFARTGKRLGIETPYMDKVIECILKLQNGEVAMEHAWEANLKAFDTL